MVSPAEVKLVLGYDPDSGQEIRFEDGLLTTDRAVGDERKTIALMRASAAAPCRCGAAPSTRRSGAGRSPPGRRRL